MSTKTTSTIDALVNHNADRLEEEQFVVELRLPLDMGEFFALQEIINAEGLSTAATLQTDNNGQGTYVLSATIKAHQKLRQRHQLCAADGIVSYSDETSALDKLVEGQNTETVELSVPEPLRGQVTKSIYEGSFGLTISKQPPDMHVALKLNHVCDSLDSKLSTDVGATTQEAAPEHAADPSAPVFLDQFREKRNGQQELADKAKKNNSVTVKADSAEAAEAAKDNSDLFVNIHRRTALNHQNNLPMLGTYEYVFTMKAIHFNLFRNRIMRNPELELRDIQNGIATLVLSAEEAQPVLDKLGISDTVKYGLDVAEKNGGAISVFNVNSGMDHGTIVADTTRHPDAKSLVRSAFVGKNISSEYLFFQYEPDSKGDRTIYAIPQLHIGTVKTHCGSMQGTFPVYETPLANLEKEAAKIAAGKAEPEPKLPAIIEQSKSPHPVKVAFDGETAHIIVHQELFGLLNQTLGIVYNDAMNSGDDLLQIDVPAGQAKALMEHLRIDRFIANMDHDNGTATVATEQGFAVSKEKSDSVMFKSPDPDEPFVVVLPNEDDIERIRNALAEKASDKLSYEVKHGNQTFFVVPRDQQLHISTTNGIMCNRVDYFPAKVTQQPKLPGKLVKQGFRVISNDEQQSIESQGFSI